jgi:hypothetical protein
VESLKGSHGMGDRWIFLLKKPVPLSLMKTYEMGRISIVFILLDSTFNLVHFWKKQVFPCFNLVKFWENFTFYTLNRLN